MGTIDIATVNAMADEEFTACFGEVLEDSPHLAAAVAARRPFDDAGALAEAFTGVVRGLDPDAAVELVRAHPELGARRPMAASSVEEQASAGLPGAAAEIQARLATGNAAYREHFGFPFVLAVRGRTPDEIVEVLEARLGNAPDIELRTALVEISAIARLRLDQIVTGP